MAAMKRDRAASVSPTDNARRNPSRDASIDPGWMPGVAIDDSCFCISEVIRDLPLLASCDYLAIARPQQRPQSREKGTEFFKTAS